MFITKNPFGELCEDCRVKQNLGRQGRLNKLDKEKSKYYDKIKKQVLHMQNFSCTLKFKVGKKIHHKITSKEAGSVHKKFILVGLTSPPCPSSLLLICVTPSTRFATGCLIDFIFSHLFCDDLSCLPAWPAPEQLYQGDEDDLGLPGGGLRLLNAHAVAPKAQQAHAVLAFIKRWI